MVPLFTMEPSLSETLRGPDRDMPVVCHGAEIVELCAFFNEQFAAGIYSENSVVVGGGHAGTDRTAV